MEHPFRFEDIPADPRDLARDCLMTFTRASGPGGQHRNKTETAVRIVHLPTGLVAMAAEERSQSRNRERAFERLREKLLRQLRPKKKRKPTRVPKSAKESRLREKLLHSRQKKLRGTATED
jgi:protein subunit release factor B